MMEHAEKWVYPETKEIRETEDRRERKDQPVPRFVPAEKLSLSTLYACIVFSIVGSYCF